MPNDLEHLTIDALKFLREVNNFTGLILQEPHANLTGEKTFLLAYRLRMFRQSQAIELLIERKLFDPAAAILRVLLEQSYVLSAVDDDASRLAILFDEEGVEGAKALRGLRKDLTESERHPDLTDVTLDAAIANLPSGSGFAAYNWAGLAKLGASYATLYRRTCTFSHGGAGGTLEYFIADAEGNPLVQDNVNPKLGPELLIAAAALMLDGFRTLPFGAMTPERNQKQLNLENQLKHLNNRSL